MYAFHLRTYPPRFALKLVRLFPRFIRNKEALPDMGPPELMADSVTIFNQVEWGDWCDLKTVFTYLRGSIDLELGEWRSYLPTHI